MFRLPEFWCVRARVCVENWRQPPSDRSSSKLCFLFAIPLGVGRILAYNIDSQAHLIEQEQKRLFADCTDIQADIQREIQERKAQFDVKVTPHVGQNGSFTLSSYRWR